MKIWKWERYFYFLILKKPLHPNRLAAIKQGKAWLRANKRNPLHFDGKPLFNVAPPKEEGKEDESHAASPRHTPEELDRLIEEEKE